MNRTGPWTVWAAILILWWSLTGSAGCCPPVAPEASPHLPPLPEQVTQAQVDEAMRRGGVPAVAALYGGAYLKGRHALEAMAREGAWAETPEEREALLAR